MTKELQTQALENVSSMSADQLEETLQSIGCSKCESGETGNLAERVDEEIEQALSSSGYCEILEQYAYAIVYMLNHIMLDKIYSSEEEAKMILKHLPVSDRRLYDVAKIALKFVKGENDDTDKTYTTCCTMGD